MSEEIIKVFDYIGQKLGIAIDYTQENIYPYLEDLWHRYVNYEIITRSLWSIIPLVVIIVTIIVLKKLYLSHNEALKGNYDNLLHEKDYRGDAELTMLGSSLLIGSIITLVVCIPILICNIQSLIEWLYIPEKCVMQTLGIIKLN